MKDVGALRLQRIGKLALGIAAFNDCALWILLGLLLTDVSGRAPEGLGMLASLLILPFYLAGMVVFVRPLLRRTIKSRMKNGEISASAATNQPQAARARPRRLLSKIP